MARLPDIPIEAWVGYIQDSFEKSADALGSALSFRMQSLETLEQMPLGTDQNPLYDSYEAALQQDAEEEARRREEEALLLEQQRLEAENQQIQAALEAAARRSDYELRLGGVPENPGEPEPLSPYPDVAPNPDVRYPMAYMDPRDPGSEVVSEDVGLRHPLHRGQTDPQYMDEAGDNRPMGGFGKPYDPAEIEASRVSMLRSMAPQEGQSFADYSASLVGQLEPVTPDPEGMAAPDANLAGEPEPLSDLEPASPGEPSLAPGALPPELEALAPAQADPYEGKPPHEKALLQMSDGLSMLSKQIHETIQGQIGGLSDTSGVSPDVAPKLEAQGQQMDATAAANPTTNDYGSNDERGLHRITGPLARTVADVAPGVGRVGELLSGTGVPELSQFSHEIQEKAKLYGFDEAKQAYEDNPDAGNARRLIGIATKLGAFDIPPGLATIAVSAAEKILPGVPDTGGRPAPNPLGLDENNPISKIRLRDLVNALPGGVGAHAATLIPEDATVRDAGKALGVEEGAKFGIGDVAGNFGMPGSGANAAVRAGNVALDAAGYTGIIAALMEDPDNPLTQILAGPIVARGIGMAGRHLPGIGRAAGKVLDPTGPSATGANIMEQDVPRDIPAPDVPVTHPTRGGLAVGEEFAPGTPEATVSETLRRAAEQSPDGLAHLTSEEIQALPGMPILDAPAPTQAVDKQGNPRFTKQGKPIMTVDMRGRAPDLDGLRAAVEVGLPQSTWYNDFGRWAKDTLGPANIDEFRTLFGITSVQTPVDQNFIYTMMGMRIARELDQAGKLADRDAWEDAFRNARWDAPVKKRDRATGRMVPTGELKENKVKMTSSQIDKVYELYNNGIVENPAAAKTASYGTNIATASRGEYDPNSTMDVWQFQLMGWVDSFAPQQSDQSYRSTLALFNHLAAEKGLNPNQAQAASWFALKQMSEQAPEVRKQLNAGEISLTEAIRRAAAKGAYDPSKVDADFMATVNTPGGQQWFNRAKEVLSPDVPGPGRAGEAALIYPGDTRQRIRNAEGKLVPNAPPRTVTPETTAAGQERALAGAPRLAIDQPLERGAVPELEHVPHEVATYGDTSLVYLPGGNAETARFAAAAIGKHVGAEEVVVHIPSSQAATVGGVRIAHPEGIILDQEQLASAVADLRRQGHEVFVDPQRKDLSIVLPEGADSAAVTNIVNASHEAAAKFGLTPDDVVAFTGDVHRVPAAEYGRNIEELGGTYGPARRLRVPDGPGSVGEAPTPIRVGETSTDAGRIAAAPTASVVGRNAGTSALSRTASYAGSTVTGAAASGVEAAQEEGATPESVAKAAAMGAARGALGRALKGSPAESAWSSRIAPKATWDMSWDTIYPDRTPTKQVPDEPNVLERIRATVSDALFDNRTYLNKLQEKAQKQLGRLLTYDEQVSFLTRKNTDMAAKVLIDENLKPAVQLVGEDIDYWREQMTYLDDIAVAERTTNKVLRTKTTEIINLEREVRRLERKMQKEIDTYGSPMEETVEALDGVPDEKYGARERLEQARFEHEQDAAMAGEGRKFSGDIEVREAEARLEEMREKLGPERWARLEEANDMVQDWVDSYRDRMFESGIIGQEQLDALRAYSFYIPTRIIDHINDEAAVATGGRVSLADTGIRKNTVAGTTKDREDPIQSLIRMAYDVEGRIARNDAFNAFHNLHENPQTADIFKATRVENGVKVTTDAESGWRSKSIQGYVKGEKVAYVIEDRAVAEALKMRSDAFTHWMNQSWLGKGATFFRESITRTPVFIAGQVGLDAFGAMIREASIEGSPLAAVPMARELMKAYGDLLFSAKGQTDLWQGTWSGDAARMWKEGAGMSGWQDQSQKGLKTTVADLQRKDEFDQFSITSKDDLLRVGAWLGKLEWSQAVGARLEAAPRLAAFRRAEQRMAKMNQKNLRWNNANKTFEPKQQFDAKTTGLYAAMEARDVTLDFQRGGFASKMLNSMIPFFNVGFQGAAQILRTAKANPGGFVLTTGSLVALPTMAAEFYNRSTEEMAKDYEDIPDYVKRRNWILMAPFLDSTDAKGNRKPGYISIPLRELAPIAVMSRDVARTMIKNTGLGTVKDNVTAQDLFWDMLATTSPIQASNPGDAIVGSLPYGATTGVQLATDKDTFRNRMIATDKNDEQASNVSKKLSELAFKMGVEWRPSQIEFALRDTTGHAGAAVLAGVDQASGRDLGEDEGIGGAKGFGGLAKKYAGNATGERLNTAKERMVSRDTQQFLHSVGLRSDSISPVPAKLQGVELTREEQTRWQEAFNVEFEKELATLQRSSEFRRARTNEAKEELIRKAANAARSKTGQAILTKMTSTRKRQAARAGAAA